MALDFPTATTVGQTYTDPTSGNTYVVTVVGPPAQWVGSGSSTSLDNTYLRKDASNDPVTGTLTVTPATNVEGLVVTQPSGNSAAALRITNEGSGNSLLIEDSANPDSSPIVADSSGRLLMGTTTSTTIGATNTAIAQVETGQFSALSLRRNVAGFAGPGLSISHSRGTTSGSYTALISGDECGGIYFYGADGTQDVGCASIAASVDGTAGANDMPGRLVFSTTADGSASPTERMRIDSSGRLLVGLTSANASGGVLQLSGGITFPATQVAATDPNTLDDYEEGTWTPQFFGSNSGVTNSGMFASNNSTYVKIGNFVRCVCRFSWVQGVNTTLSGYIGFNGLPFTAGTSPAGNTCITGGHWNSDPAFAYPFGFNVLPNESANYMKYTTSAGVQTWVTGVNTGANNSVYIIITYTV